jgi:hypothetical protein
MSLSTRISRLEAALGVGDRPQRALIWYGDVGSSIERRDGVLHLGVPCGCEDRVWLCMTPEQNAALRGVASIAAFEVVDSPRDQCAIDGISSD